MKNQRIVLFVLLCLLYACSPQQETESGKPPHVLFIAIDDLRDWTGYHKAFPQVKTPHLDKLAAESTIFIQAFCAAPVCAASRTALLTGLSPSQTGVYENGQRWEETLQQHSTLTHHFRENGYYVVGFGKIYHGQGKLEYWDEFEYGKYTPCPENPENPLALGNPLDIPDSLTGDWQRVTNAMAVMEKDIEKPLFLACGIIRPHTPWNVPRKYFDMYPLESIQLPPVKADDLADIPPIGQKIAQRMHENHYCGADTGWTHAAMVDADLWKQNIRAYLASITYADYQVGRLIEAWKKSPYGQNSIIVLWGDHGWHLGEKQHWSKRTLWDVGSKTPLLIHRTAARGAEKVEQPVSLLDIFPTLVELCQLPQREDLDGVSLLPLLENKQAVREEPAITVWGKGNVALRTADWRLIRYCDGTRELYDHQQDPNEWNNLAEIPKYQSVIANLEKWLPSQFAEPTKHKRTSWFELENIACQ